MHAAWRRWASLSAAPALAVALAACTPDLPPGVQEGTTVKVGWAQQLTSTNAGSRPGATTGNRDVAAMTRARFAEVVNGDVVLDKGFGKVRIADNAASSFTVRYDLAKPSWSDGVPLDAADLLLAWAAGSNALADHGGRFDAVAGSLSLSTRLPHVDEFARRIDVRFSRPVEDWQTALDVAVPAHVVGRLALGVEDPMQAKQAVIEAFRKRDAHDLAAIARAWNSGFDVKPSADKVPADVLLSSGPYRVDRLSHDGDGQQRVRLVANARWTRNPTPSYEHVLLVHGPARGQLADLGLRLDVVQLLPIADDWSAVRAKQRRDYHVSPSNDGTMWVLALRADRGVFRNRAARFAFLRTVPRSDLTSAGGGPWAESYGNVDSLLFPPASSGYEVALEDSGFVDTYQKVAGQRDLERKLAGAPAGAPVCVLYDRHQAFAKGALGALRAGVAEAGWNVRDCGSGDFDSARRGGSWDAVLTAVPVPVGSRDIGAQWGSKGALSLTGLVNRTRDKLIRELARATDKYAARDLRVAIEASIVADGLALPLAMQPVVTVADRDLEGVQPRPGGAGSLTSGIAAWNPVGS